MLTMKKSLLARNTALVLVVVMTVFSLVPRVDASFIPSEESAASSLRSKDLGVVQKVLEQKMVQERLRSLGYSEEEIQARLDLLTDAELHQLATQLDTLTAGGDGIGFVIGILLIIVLVLLILHLTGTRLTLP